MQAFEGIRVLDLTHVLAGPFTSYQLAVLGADVIKIEAVDRPDMNREIGPIADLNDAMRGSHFQCQAGNKRAMTLNLKTDSGKEIFEALAKDADVIVENYRSGAMDRLGLGFEDIRAINPGIVYCSLTGFGNSGPKRGHAAFDNVIQAYSGLMAATGDPGNPYQVGPPVLDYGTGAQAAFAIASALFRRERCGEGQHIDIAMLDAALMFMTSNAVNYSLTGWAPVPPGNRGGGGGPFAGYGWYDAADTLLAIGIVTPAQHVRMWQLFGREDLAEEARGMSMKDMETNRDRDEALLTDIVKTKTADEWEALFNEAGLPAARMRSLDEALSSDQVASRGVLGDPLPTQADSDHMTPTVAAFVCSEDGPSVTRPAPSLGQDTDVILQDLGYDPRAIAALREAGVV